MGTEPFDPRDGPAWRRQQAWRLSQLGWKSCDIAVALSASAGAVSRWLSAARHGGTDALVSRPIPRTPGPAQHRTASGARLPLARGRGLRVPWRRLDLRAAGVLREELGVGYGKSHLKNPSEPFAADNRRVQVINASDK